MLGNRFLPLNVSGNSELLYKLHWDNCSNVLHKSRNLTSLCADSSPFLSVLPLRTSSYNEIEFQAA